MKRALHAAPPGLLAAALAFWGWRSGHWAPALALAPLLEAHRWVPGRWQFEDADFNRIADLSTVGFLLLVVYQFSAQPVLGIHAVLGWMPAVLAPLLLAQLYGARGVLNLGALFLSLRRGERSRPGRRIDLSLPYVLVCLVASSPGTEDRPVFLAGALVVMAWALWPARPRRYPALLFVGLMAGLGAGALWAGDGVLRVQAAVERGVGAWLAERWAGRTDPDQSWTAIGRLGRLKLSERIELRVRFSQPPTGPVLLREAAYTTYRFGTWRGDDSPFELLDLDPGLAPGGAWPLAPAAPGPERVRISLRFEEDSRLVPLPLRAARLAAGGTLTGVQRNGLDALRVDARPGVVELDLALAAEPPGAAAPSALFGELPAGYAEPLGRLAAEALGGARADELPPRARVAALERWFAEHFRYSLYQRQRFLGPPLLDFLQRGRAGHCEYFASATVLMLRSLGVPARYAVGYVVEEWSALEQAFVARARHRHAWAEAWVDGRWHVVDTTPARWLALEAERGAGWLRPLGDLLSWLRHAWAGAALGEPLREALPWALLPLLALLGWRLRARRRAGVVPARTARAQATGGGAELAPLLESLAREGWAAAPGETLGGWLSRVAAGHPRLGPHAAALAQVLRLRYRQAFDPRGLDETGLARLRALAGELRARLGR